MNSCMGINLVDEGPVATRLILWLEKNSILINKTKVGQVKKWLSQKRRKKSCPCTVLPCPLKQEFLCCKLLSKEADTWIYTCVQMLYLSLRKLDVILGVPYDPIVIAICNSKHPPKKE